MDLPGLLLDPRVQGFALLAAGTVAGLIIPPAKQWAKDRLQSGDEAEKAAAAKRSVETKEALRKALLTPDKNDDMIAIAQDAAAEAAVMNALKHSVDRAAIQRVIDRLPDGLPGLSLFSAPRR